MQSLPNLQYMYQSKTMNIDISNGTHLYVK